MIKKWISLNREYINKKPLGISDCNSDRSLSILLLVLFILAPSKRDEWFKLREEIYCGWWVFNNSIYSGIVHFCIELYLHTLEPSFYFTVILQSMPPKFQVCEQFSWPYSTRSVGSVNARTPPNLSLAGFWMDLCEVESQSCIISVIRSSTRLMGEAHVSWLILQHSMIYLIGTIASPSLCSYSKRFCSYFLIEYLSGLSINHCVLLLVQLPIYTKSDPILSYASCSLFS